MANIQVVTDSACDLTPSSADSNDIRVVPLTIRFGPEELVDRDELSVKEFWDRVMTGPHMPETAAPAPGAFRQAYLDAAEAGADGVVCVTLSSGLSATFQAATTA
ncbi:MAG TPA: DegV family protein, partial [Acidimicrobiales bacterium]